MQGVPRRQERRYCPPSGGLTGIGKSDQRTRNGEQTQDFAALHVVIITMEEGWSSGEPGCLGRLFVGEQICQLGEGHSQQRCDLRPLVGTRGGATAFPTDHGGRGH
ncbi:hypothetical protein SVEN_1981 [Streptomyces venezuelae ATCC 10712]|uniref:Uncharacterized protein n=1 Tax=Streptomyces venezuelae (strain ATCC 10712 / CBS 650.69 / DSM 40230 / JCM 4526 / NBRC 13096 / PD 04745) TaxID=953739 RepID=F2RKM9_STRVP|nr:hypothetical protein SVEN_1981 [Streptomyces venezuelae ATCC 10712]